MSDAMRLACGTRREDLHALHDGALPPGRAATLRTHAAGCPHCGAELEFLRGVSAALGEAHEAAALDATWQCITARLAAPGAARQGAGTLAWAGAAVALAALVAWLLASAWTAPARQGGDPLLAAVTGESSDSATVSSAALLNFAMGGGLEEPVEPSGEDEATQ
jgi:anti-sigma factor RsiW